MKVMGAQRAAVVPLHAALDSPDDRLAALFDAHEERLYRLARRLASSADEAQDFVQETFLRAAASLNAVPIGASREEAWLVRVLVNIGRDHWRKLAVRRRAAATMPPPPHAGGADEALAVKRAVWSALDALGPRRRAIVVMHELEGLDLPAMASLLGVTVVTVRWHLSMGRRQLRRLLAAHVGDIR
jgi:RNA polymerase sigma-70 factor (ECF subfamily)